MAHSIDWLGQATVRIESKSGSTIYFDPFRITETDSADIVFITHDHKDHLDPVSISKLVSSSTQIIAPLSCRKAIEEYGHVNTIYLSPWDSTKVSGIPVLAVPAYNIEKRYHPKEKNYLGYIITVDGIRIYHAGDTERIPEMQQFECDIAMLPLGQKYTMNSIYDVANTAMDVKARVVIPIHWGLFEGSQKDVEQLRTLLQESITLIVKSNNMEE